MKNKTIKPAKYISAALLTISMGICAFGQATTMPDILTTGTLNDQMKYLTEKTLIYENYRAIREDMFQKIKNNSLDSLSAAEMKIAGLNNLNARLNRKVDSLKSSLGAVKQNLDDVTKTKDSLSFIGLEINKSAYNGIVWTIIFALVGILALGFMIFKRNISVTNKTRKDSEDLKKEFEAYRKASREAREKMSMAHFYELKKIRGG